MAALATPAFAAVWATLSPTAGQPDDVITLTTLEWVSAGPVYLISTDDFQAGIARFGGQVCGNSRAQHYLGRLTQQGDTGSLSFRVPEVARGDYYFELTVQAGCWRVGASGGGPLVLKVSDHSIAQTPAARITAETPRGSLPAVGGPLGVLAVLAAAVVVGALLTTVTLLRRRKQV
jgi:hypothetical protein